MQHSVLTNPFQTDILRWFEQHGRKDLPWQQNKSPYSIWISEIMLQQTQVKTVIPYYKRFMQRFPSLATLAGTPIDAVLSHWTGLGYYARARNLHKTAQIIESEYEGNFPDTFGQLTTLPGIGRSTAGAILSFGFQLSYPILDGNIKRVLTRVKGITNWPGTPKATEQLWQLAETLTPAAHTAAYNQAMMDMGALLCTTKDPNCPLCPVQSHCCAYQNSLQNQIPARPPRKNKPSQRVFFLMIRHRNKILLEKRPNKGIWGGLWSFPEIAIVQPPPTLTLPHKGGGNKKEPPSPCESGLEPAPENLFRGGILQKHLQALATQLQLKVASYQAWPLFLHQFTHRTLEIMPIQVLMTGKNALLPQNRGWFTPLETASLGLPAPSLKLIQQLQTPSSPLTNPSLVS